MEIKLQLTICRCLFDGIKEDIYKWLTSKRETKNIIKFVFHKREKGGAFG